MKSKGEARRTKSEAKRMLAKFTHLDEQGQAKMVDITDKTPMCRKAVARGVVKMRPKTFQLIKEGKIEKGDLLVVARLAGIMAAKRTSELIPLCHPLQLTEVDVSIQLAETKSLVKIESVVRNVGRTGVEMEALTAVSVAALTIYDMCKAVDKEMIFSDIHLVEKSGGKSGTFVRNQKGEFDGQA
jgi:cyclic pyranopterin phosphate synthase